MTRTLEFEKVANSAGEYFGSGYHCAEAVAKAILESQGQDSSLAIPYATAFGGGVGQTFSQLCGVISGGLIVIGHFHGRREQGASWEDASQLGNQLVKRFVALHGTCHCGALRERFGEVEQMDRCRDLVRSGTVGLLTILEQMELADD